MQDRKFKIIKESELKKVSINHKKPLFKNIILSDGDVPGLIQLAAAEFKRNDNVEMHHHESMTEVFHLISGSLKLYLDKNEYEINRGDTFVIYPKQSHSLVFTQNSKLFYFNLPVID